MADEAAGYVGQLSADRRWRWDGTSWRPTDADSVQWHAPLWASLRLRRAATWAMFGGAVLVGLITDQAIRSGAIGLASSLALIFAALVLVFAGTLVRLESRLVAAAAAAFGLCLALRASPWLIWPDIAAALVLLCVAASIAARGSLLDLGIAESLARGVHGAVHGLAGAPFVLKPILRMRARVAAIVPVARGLLIAAPIAVLLAALLASADPIFASFLKVDIDLGRLLLDVVYVAIGAAAIAGLLRLAAAEPVDRVDGPAWRLGAVEGLVVLAVLDVVFGAFAIAQAIAASGTAGSTLRAAGVTYSDYARNGFFQLLWVAGITLVVLVLFSRVTRLYSRRARLAFVALAEIAIALTLLIVAVAFVRLGLYESAYGFTTLRLYSHIFAGWVAVVYLLLAADLVGVFQQQRWFVGAAGLTALLLLLALNVINPEAVVVRLNADRAVATHKIDAQYLRELSSDATPALFAERSRLDPALQPEITRVLCAGPRTYSPSLAAYNWADVGGARVRRKGC